MVWYFYETNTYYKNKFNNLNSRFDNYTRTINLGDYFKYFLAI